MARSSAGGRNVSEMPGLFPSIRVAGVTSSAGVCHALGVYEGGFWLGAQPNPRVVLLVTPCL